MEEGFILQNNFIFNKMNSITKCIRNRHPIPSDIEITDEMKSSLNSSGYTQAQWWIIHMMSNPPACLRHDPSIRDKRGNTAYMLWLQVLHFEPPKWMRHDPYLKNYYGDTAEIVWYKFVTTPPPDYLKCVYEIEEDTSDTDPSEDFTSASSLTHEKQAKILLFNEVILRAKTAYAQYKRFCAKYRISRPMPEVELHEILSKYGTKELNEDNEVVYKSRRA